MPEANLTESPWVRRARRGYRAYRYAPFSPAHGLVRRLAGTLVGRRHRIRLRSGLWMEVDLASEIQQTIFWTDGDYEPQLQWIIRELLPVGSQVVDCGANTGIIGLAARRFRSCPVCFVEPHPRLADTVRRNIALNGWEDSCRVVEAAASNRVGEAVLYENSEEDGSHSLNATWGAREGGVQQIRVRTAPLPDLLGDLWQDRIGLLKIDAEGHDYEVLEGLGDCLNPDRLGIVYVELGGEDRTRGRALLERAGFTGFGQRPLRPRQQRAILRRLYAGEPAVLFEPIPPSSMPEGETLWVPAGGSVARHLGQLCHLAG